MMDIAVLIPIAGIVATAWVIVSILRYRTSRHELTATSSDENLRLQRENESLKQDVGQLEDRLAVLERIVTDPAERTSREIERLR